MEDKGKIKKDCSVKLTETSMRYCKPKLEKCTVDNLACATLCYGAVLVAQAFGDCFLPFFFEGSHFCD